MKLKIVARLESEWTKENSRKKTKPCPLSINPLKTTTKQNNSTPLQ